MMPINSIISNHFIKLYSTFINRNIAEKGMCKMKIINDFWEEEALGRRGFGKMFILLFYEGSVGGD
jgi:hypothetical protein